MGERLSIFDVFTRWRRQPVTEFSFWLEEGGKFAEAEDGSELEGRGFWLRDEVGAAVAWHDPRLAAGDTLIFKVAGVSYRHELLQSPAFAPGRPLVVRHEPSEEHPEAMGVWDVGESSLLGYVPQEFAAEVRGIVERRQDVRAMSLWEWRDDRGERCGLRVLLSPMIAER